MADAAPKTNRALAFGKTVTKFAAAWAFLYWFGDNDGRLYRIGSVFRDVIYKIFAGFPSLATHAQAVFDDFTGLCGQAFFLTLFFGTGLAVLGAAARMVARARLRAGQADFLDRLRAWTAAHPKATRALLAAPALLWMTNESWPGPYELDHLGEMIGPYGRALVPLLLAGWGMYAMAKKGLRELLAPTTGGGELARFEIGPDEIAFDAVAVTRETLVTVGVFAAITLAVPSFIWTRPILDLFHDTSIFYLVGAYAAFAAGGALAFRRASRVSIGVDGVLIRGTSRARFFAYRDIDSARANGGDIELVRRGSVVLRLQLHGEDAARRDAVLARIAENVARVREGRGAAAAQLVASSSANDLARLAHGAGDYRMATLSREQLWALVEGPEIEAQARKAAAEALVRSSDQAERARLRVAAERCAEPQVRIDLAEIADAVDEVSSLPPDGSARATS
jgi:hypothetical protein